MMPERRWGDEETAPAEPPTVIVSSRDGASVPRVAAALRLVKVAEANGWTARLTYALAAVPDRPRKRAHILASVALRLARGVERGWAVWTNTDDKGWRFDVAWFFGDRFDYHGARAIAARLAVRP